MHLEFLGAGNGTLAMRTTRGHLPLFDIAVQLTGAWRAPGAAIGRGSTSQAVRHTDLPEDGRVPPYRKRRRLRMSLGGRLPTAIAPRNCQSAQGCYVGDSGDQSFEERYA